MKIVCSANMPFAREAFSTLGDVLILPERTITARNVRDADILAVRSATKTDRRLLAGSSVKFVGSATIGTDHMDTGWLDDNGIAWCAAPGCNANSVSEYVVSALLCLAQRRRFRLADKVIGVIGVGNVGSLVARKATALGMQTLLNDPPRQRAEDRDQRSEFVSLVRVLEEADIVTLHVPLTRKGPDATFHMADRDFFSKVKPGCILINSARGAVVDSDALLAAVRSKAVRSAVIDTWEGEPAFRKDILNAVDLGTPHIAGYSFDGKVTGTLMVYREICGFLNAEPVWKPDALMPPPSLPEMEVDGASGTDDDILWKIVSGIYNIEEDDHRLREGDTPDPARQAERFDRLRRTYPMRREFHSARVLLKNTPAALAATIAGLGFKTG